MTIASSVIDVRNIDNNELFFYRVGCVPEAYVWKKLHNLKEEAPPLVADIGSAKNSVIQSLMSQITRLVGCETYKIHILIDPQFIDNIASTPWDDVGQRTKSAFVSGISFYNDGESSEEGEAAEMISPLLNSQGDVNKTSGPAQFQREDLMYSSLVSRLVCDNLPTFRTDYCRSWSDASVVTLTENGFMEKLAIETNARPTIDRRKLFRNSKSKGRGKRWSSRRLGLLTSN